MKSMKWSDESVLVTGEDGFIRSHLTEHLIELTADVKALLRDHSRNSWA